MIWNRKKKTRIKEISNAVDTAAQQLKSQETQVKAVSSWLERRKNQNGFGADFEYTLRPRGAK